MTNLGRSRFLGPYYVIFAHHVARWTRLVGSNAVVRGLFQHGGAGLGVTWEPGTSRSGGLNPTVPVFPAMPEVIRNSMNMILTTASLLDISLLQIHHDGGRCLGMLIRHQDGITDVVGRWDGARPQEVTTIYDESDDEPLTGVIFHMAKCGNLHHVTDVIAVTGPPPTPSEAHLFLDKVSHENEILPVQSASEVFTNFHRSPLHGGLIANMISWKNGWGRCSQL